MCPPRSGSTFTTAIPTRDRLVGAWRSSSMSSRDGRVGWAMAATEDGKLVELALRMAVVKRQPPAGLLHHADRGSELSCQRYQAVLREVGCEVSMSRTGDCSENAAMEAFFATLTRVVY